MPRNFAKKTIQVPDLLSVYMKFSFIFHTLYPRHSRAIWHIQN
ncbi:hypothetical protein GGE39_003401 [Rhizobium leguminosarum]|nr:hypothetical protein [Rhizobium leguminosarum]